MLNRVLNGLLKLLLDLVQTTDVVPGGSWNLDDSLPEGRRVGHTKREAEVLHGYAERIEDFGVDGVSA